MKEIIMGALGVLAVYGFGVALMKNSAEYKEHEKEGQKILNALTEAMPEEEE